MAKTKPRYLRLQVKFDAPGATKETVVHTLVRSIQNGDYEYPEHWRVAIGWSNKESLPLKWGEWTKEMIKSAASSSGWDLAVTSYLENRL